MKALIFDIKRFAVHDGPGIRTTVFFKGCPLSCPWCHNPESRSDKIDYYEHTDRIGDRTYTSKKSVGRYYTVRELLAEVLKDEIFYNESNGGITCSGGEPLSQVHFLRHFLIQCVKKGLHTALDTSGYTENGNLLQIAPYVDLFLFDIKHLNDQVHLRYTGVSNKGILENFNWIVQTGYHTIARIPVIPEINADSDHFMRLSEYLGNRLRPNFNEVHLLPYHRIGCGKYAKFKINGDHQFDVPQQEAVEEFIQMFKQKGFITKLGG